MKSKLFIISSLILLVIVWQGCLLDDTVIDYGDTPILVQFASPSVTANFVKGDGNSAVNYSIPVTLIGGRNQPIDKDITVTFDVASNSEAKEGQDFSFPNGKSVTIHAGEMTAPVVISIHKDEADPFDAKDLTLEIVSTSDLTISESDKTIIKLQAVCPIVLESFVGTYTVTDNVSGSSYKATIEIADQANTLVITNVWNRGGKAALQLSIDPVEPYITYNSESLGYVLIVHSTFGDAWATTLSETASTFNSCDNSLHLVFKLCVSAGCFGNQFDFNLVKD